MPQDTAPTDTQDLLVSLDDGVLTLTFNRPEARNALTPAMIGRLGEELRDAEPPQPRLGVDGHGHGCRGPEGR